MKRYRTIIFIILLSALLCVNLTPVYANQTYNANQNLEIALDTYLSERAAILRTNHSWVNYGTYYKCTICGLTSTNPPGVNKAAPSIA